MNISVINVTAKALISSSLHSFLKYFADTSIENDNLQRPIATECVCLDVQPSELKIADHFQDAIQLFKDKCACISYLLSTEKKLTFFVTSTAAAKIVVPLIHDHRCIRYIYLNSDGDLAASLMEKFGKIRGGWSSIDQLREQMILDIQSCKTRSSRWARHPNLFTELWAQSINKSSQNIMLLPQEKISDITILPNIVVLYHNGYRPFYLSYRVIRIHEFDNIEHCSNFIENNGIKSSIFLIICIMSTDFYGLVQPCMEFDCVCGAYIFCNRTTAREVQTTLLDANVKVSGIFGDGNGLLLQLCNDICFYRQLPFHMPKITVLRSDVNRIEELNKHEVDLIRFQLFVEILPKISFANYPSSVLNAIASDAPLYDLVSNPKFGQIVNALFNQCDLPALLETSSLLNCINERLGGLTSKRDGSPTAIYRAQVIDRNYVDMLRKNINGLLTIHTFTLFSQSFSSTIDICHRCVENGLTVVLLETELSESTSAAQIDPDTFAYSLGSAFRVLSIAEMADGVWHAQLELIDCVVEYIKEQLPFEIDVRDTWLTFGNYMTTLERFEESKVYYEYLLRHTSPDDPIRASIFNNMGLMYSAMNEEDEALTLFQESSKVFIEGSSRVKVESDPSSYRQEAVSDLEFHPATVYGKIAEAYDRQNEYAKAHGYYQKALQFAPNTTTNSLYRTAIKRTLEKLSK